MIATGLVFVFGALVATLVALLLVPLVWRQARRLARRDFLATMPTSLNEIRAEVDRVRAEAAMTVRRQEIASQSVREAQANVRAEMGRLTIAKAEMERRLRETTEQNAVLSEEIAALTSRLQSRDDQFVDIEGQHRNLRLDFDRRAVEIEGLTERYRELNSVADERRVRLVTAETRVDGLESELRAVRRELQRERERAEASEALLAETRGRLNHYEGADPDVPVPVVEEETASDAAPEAPVALASDGRGALPVDATTLEALSNLRERARSDAPPSPDEVRETVAEIAADILYTAAIAQPDSKAAALLDPATTSSPLAQRVRARQAKASGTAPSSPSADAAPIQISAEPASELPTTPSNGSGKADTAEPVKLETAPKRRRGGARSRQRSPR